MSVSIYDLRYGGPLIRSPAPTSESLQSRVIESALSGLAATSRRVYKSRIEAFVRWLGTSDLNAAVKALALDREHVKQYLRSLELQGASPQVRNQALAALKQLAYEAGELRWIQPEIAAQIQTIKSKKQAGIRQGKWLTVAQAAALLGAIDNTMAIGKRDAAVIALLLGCGLRRSEATALRLDQIQTQPQAQVQAQSSGRDGLGDGQSGRMLLVNLVGKGGRVRSVAVPRWAEALINEWKDQVEAL